MIVLYIPRLAILASLGLAAINLQSQTFNTVHYNEASGFAVGHSVRENADGFLVFGHQTQLDTTTQDCTVSKFDESGHLVSENFLNWPRYEFYGLADPISTISASSGFIAGIATFLGPFPTATAYAARFDYNGDTTWTKPLLTDSIITMRKAVYSNDKFYFCGLRASGVLIPNSTYVIQTDTLGNIENTTLYGAIEPYNMDVDETGNRLICGVRNNQGYLLKTDTVGAGIWNQFQPKPRGLWYNVKHMSGNRILCMGGWTDSHFPLADTTTMYLSMYDGNGNMLWDFVGLKNKGGTNWAYFTDGYQDTDSTFIVTGAIQQLYWNRAVIYRFTLDGEVIWRRDYAHFANFASIYPEIPRDIEPTSDGGMVFTGDTWNADTVPPLSDVNMWLVKLDSMGCLVPGCQFVGINDITYGLQAALKVWPNPTAGLAKLSLSLPAGMKINGQLLLQVFDSHGTLVMNENIGLQHEQVFEIDLSNRARGLYSAHISDRSRILTGAKLILE
jgi:hypothetical protein